MTAPPSRSLTPWLAAMLACSTAASEPKPALVPPDPDKLLLLDRRVVESADNARADLDGPVAPAMGSSRSRVSSRFLPIPPSIR